MYYQEFAHIIMKAGEVPWSAVCKLNNQSESKASELEEPVLLIQRQESWDEMSQLSNGAGK